MVTIKNTCSPANIPEYLKPLMDEVIEYYKDTFGDKLISLYIAGSVPRGDFVQSKSDADFYAIVDSIQIKELKDMHATTLIKMNSAWKNKGVTSVDCKAISVNETRKPKNQRTLFILQTDSVLIYGKAQDFSYAIPDNYDELASLLNKHAKKRLEKIGNRLATGKSQTKDIQRLRKLAIRCAYGIALIRGASYSPIYETYSFAIDRYVPELSKEIAILLMESTIDDHPTATMVESAEKILSVAEFNGIQFI